MKNGVRQGTVLSPTLFSLYINCLLLQLEKSGNGCHVGNYFYGALAYADDIVLLSPTRFGLQKMFDMCVTYFKEHKIVISTNPDPAKTKTKCLYFSHIKDKNLPSPIIMGDKKLPWVNAWQHLGNELNVDDLSKPFQASMDGDTSNKRRKFIGKVHSLREEFGFLCPDMMLSIISIYATSFYGSNLWLFSSSATERLFTSWNNMIRMVWSLPNTTHRYFLEDISETPHLKASLYQRYLVFVKSITDSKKVFLSSLAKRVYHD